MTRSKRLVALLALASAAIGCSASPSETTESQSNAIVIGHCPEIHFLCDAPSEYWCHAGPPGCATMCTCAPTLGFISGAADVYSMYVSIGGSAAIPVLFDTGSVGLYVLSSLLPSSVTSTGQACSIKYGSSQNAVSGVVVSTQVTLLGSTTGGDVDPSPTTSTMPVCAVNPATAPSGFVGVMGVGFGEAAASQTAPGVFTSWNVFRQVQGIGDQGYIVGGIQPDGTAAPWVQVGANGVGASTFQLTNLASSNGDWAPSSLSATMQVGSFTQSGSLLVDTGIPEALIWEPNALDLSLGNQIPAGQDRVPNGLTVTISSASLGAATPYSFVAGVSANRPSYVQVNQLTSGSELVYNSGYALLTHYNYLFDATNGIVGFEPAN